MRLSEFLDTWTRKNRTIVLTKASYYDDMYDVVDEINEGKAGIEDIVEYVIGAFIPQWSQYREGYLLAQKWLNADVEYFFIHDKFVIIWIREVMSA